MMGSRNMNLKMKVFVLLAFSFPTTYASEKEVQSFCHGNLFLTFNSAEQVGYVMGVMDMAISSGLVSKKEKKILNFESCHKAKVSARQLADSLKKYLENNPEKRHYSCASSFEVVLWSFEGCTK